MVGLCIGSEEILEIAEGLNDVLVTRN